MSFCIINKHLYTYSNIHIHICVYMYIRVSMACMSNVAQPVISQFINLNHWTTAISPRNPYLTKLQVNFCYRLRGPPLHPEQPTLNNLNRQGPRWQMAISTLSSLPTLRLMPDVVSFCTAISCCVPYGVVLGHFRCGSVSKHVDLHVQAPVGGWIGLDTYVHNHSTIICTYFIIFYWVLNSNNSGHSVRKTTKRYTRQYQGKNM